MEISFGDNWVSLWPLAFVVLAFLLIRMRLRKSNSIYLFVFFLFSLYIIFVIDKTLFPILITDYDQGEFFHPYAGINLMPFYFGRSIISRIIYYQFIANILLTMPFGFGLSFVAKVRARAFLWLPFAVGFGIELAQFMISLALGYLYRVIDINDVIMNAIGVLIGYAFFRIFSIIVLTSLRRDNITKAGIVKYITEIAKRA